MQFAALMPRVLEPGDCELVEEFRDLLLPMFAVRNIDSNLTCVPHQVSAGGLRLGFETFVAAPAAAPAGTTAGARG